MHSVFGRSESAGGVSGKNPEFDDGISNAIGIGRSDRTSGHGAMVTKIADDEFLTMIDGGGTSKRIYNDATEKENGGGVGRKSVSVGGERMMGEGLRMQTLAGGTSGV